MELKNRLQNLKTSKTFGKYYGLMLLTLMAAFFFAVFKLLTPSNFGSADNLYFYLQSSIIYSVGACGLYFIVVMGLFDFSIGANVVLSSIVGVVLSKSLGYAGLLLGCILCGALIGFLNGFLYIKLNIPSMIVTVGLMLIFESVAYYAAGGIKQTVERIGAALGEPGAVCRAHAGLGDAFLARGRRRRGACPDGSRDPRCHRLSHALRPAGSGPCRGGRGASSL